MQGTDTRCLQPGRTVVLVRGLRLGTMTFGEGLGFGGIDDAQADAMLDAGADEGNTP